MNSKDLSYKDLELKDPQAAANQESRQNVPNEEYMYPGHNACAGCGAAQALRYAVKALGPQTIMTIPACCSSVIVGPYPLNNLQIPVAHTPFAAAAATASGIRAALDMAGDSETTVLVWVGDGGTFDIGMQSLSAAAERNERLVYVCYDNEAYMMTGIQRSSATPIGSWTTTTPVGQLKHEPKKPIIDIMLAHGIPYAATATTAYPADFINKLRTAKSIQGFSFIHLLSPCPTGWRLPPEFSVKASRLAVNSKAFPIYEVRDGGRYQITVQPSGIPVREYLSLQGRYAHFKEEDYDRFQRDVDAAWERLLRKVAWSA